MSKCLWSGGKWWRGLKEIAYPFPCCLGNSGCSWKKTQIEKKIRHFGVAKVTKFGKETLFCTRIDENIRHFISSIGPCVKQGKSSITKVGLSKTIFCTAPITSGTIDFLTSIPWPVEASSNVSTTHNFSRFAQAYLPHNQKI